MGRHGLKDYLRFLGPLFGLIAGVWAIRLVLDAAGASANLVRFCSVTVAGAVAVLLAAALVHFRRFGSYAEVVMTTILLVVWEQLLLGGAVAFAALTGTENIYSAARYSHGATSALHHIVGHLTFGVGFGTLFGAVMGSLLLWTLRKLLPVEYSRSA